MRTQASPRVQSRKAMRWGAPGTGGNVTTGRARYRAAGGGSSGLVTLRSATNDARIFAAWNAALRKAPGPPDFFRRERWRGRPRLAHDAREGARSAGVELLGNAAGEEGLAAGLDGVAHGLGHEHGVL